MSAEKLREAAALMRSRAKAASEPPWEVGGRYFWKMRSAVPGMDGFWWSVQNEDGDVANLAEGDAADAPRCTESDAKHIASWHPAVALAVADWLDAAYADWERLEHSLSAMSVRAMSGEENLPDPRALAVATAYLGSDR